VAKQWPAKRRPEVATRVSWITSASGFHQPCQASWLGRFWGRSSDAYMVCGEML